MLIINGFFCPNGHDVDGMLESLPPKCPSCTASLKRVPIRCQRCNESLTEERALYGFNTCVKHSEEKEKDHQPGTVNSHGLHEKYFLRDNE